MSLLILQMIAPHLECKKLLEIGAAVMIESASHIKKPVVLLNLIWLLNLMDSQNVWANVEGVLQLCLHFVEILKKVYRPDKQEATLHKEIIELYGHDR